MRTPWLLSFVLACSASSPWLYASALADEKELEEKVRQAVELSPKKQKELLEKKLKSIEKTILAGYAIGKNPPPSDWYQATQKVLRIIQTMRERLKTLSRLKKDAPAAPGDTLESLALNVDVLEKLFAKIQDFPSIQEAAWDLRERIEAYPSLDSLSKKSKKKLSVQPQFIFADTLQKSQWVLRILFPATWDEATQLPEFIHVYNGDLPKIYREVLQMGREITPTDYKVLFFYTFKEQTYKVQIEFYPSQENPSPPSNP